MKATGEGVQIFSPAVSVNVSLGFDRDVLRENIRSSVARGLPFVELQEEPRGESFILAAGGPSLDPQQFGPGHVGAVNRTLEHLLGLGIVPKYWLGVDPQPELARYVVRHPDITYLVASCCAPEVFDKLDGLDVRLWHSDNKIDEASVLPPHARLIWGGPTCASRAPVLAYFMGYRHVEMHGVDSSLERGRVHVYDMPQLAKPIIGVAVGDSVYWTTVSMLAQAQAVRKIARYMHGGDYMRIDVKGSGLLPALINQTGV